MFLCPDQQQTQTQQIVQSIWPNSQQNSTQSEGDFQPLGSVFGDDDDDDDAHCVVAICPFSEAALSKLPVTASSSFGCCRFCIKFTPECFCPGF